VFDPLLGRTLLTLRDGHAPSLSGAAGGSKSVTALRFSPCGWLLASGGVDRALRCWETGEGRAVVQLVGHHRTPPALLEWAADSRRLVACGRDVSPLVWRVNEGVKE
jgi:WD40 repeat protein